MKIYGISGLGADKRVFKYLTLNYKLILIDLQVLVDYMIVYKAEEIREFINKTTPNNVSST
ncbi:hypothetical protein [Polaribacter batillariae]|uniref:hypothetical protein n=1 Tax=Polaribacter batillariae TaxID=2808900 RepID=UPI001FB11BD0|nr:hypothetical protein [Polaribacter batillariae]